MGASFLAQPPSLLLQLSKFSTATRKGFPYKDVFNLQIKKLREGGVLDLLK